MTHSFFRVDDIDAMNLRFRGDPGRDGIVIRWTDRTGKYDGPYLTLDQAREFKQGFDRIMAPHVDVPE